ncbi:hypothetical protein [Micromonospora avicenniae]|uniref:hypothetical protein n=1 Tax=Micromonospora avicenniae TaxID=1198245 RepID=UPI000970A7F3|nr:hypothetical protein [Micromonospora avicenniae]
MRRVTTDRSARVTSTIRLTQVEATDRVGQPGVVGEHHHLPLLGQFGEHSGQAVGLAGSMLCTGS